MGPPTLPALERAHGMDRKARNRRELLLREARSVAERFELRTKRPTERQVSWAFHLTNCASRSRIGDTIDDRELHRVSRSRSSLRSHLLTDTPSIISSTGQFRSGAAGWW